MSQKPHRPRPLHRTAQCAWGLVAVSTLTIAACAGSGNGDSAADPPPTDAATTTTTSAPAADVPSSPSDLVRVCETTEGFSDLPRYDETAAGPHPVVVFVEGDQGISPSAIDVPREWTVGSADIEQAELVGCGTIIERSPNGESCDFQRGDGSGFSLQLVDVAYDVAIHAAATGEILGSVAVAASMTECPTGLLHNYEEGQTEYLNVFSLEFDESAIADGLEPFVAP